MIPRWRAALFVLLLLAACDSEPPKIAKLPADGVVLAFGDSLTFGTGARAEASYPAVLEELIGRRVLRAGAPGEVTARGLARLPGVLRDSAPDLLILIHGGNDLLQRKSPERIAANLRAMVLLARERGVAVVLIGVPNKPGVASRVFGDIAARNIVVDDIVQNIYAAGKKANIGFVVPAEDVMVAREICERLVSAQGFEGIECREEVAKVSAVGVGMRSHSGVAATMFEALGNAGINIFAISTSEIVISSIVAQEDGPRAMAIVHEAFGLTESNRESS